MSASECLKKTWPFFGMVARAGLAAVACVGLMLFPLEAHAARTISSATLNGGSSVTVSPGAAITAIVNVTTTGNGTAARWWSTGWSISTTAPGTVTCVDHPNHSGAAAYSETFGITAPATPGTYNAYFIAYNNDTCTGSPSATFTMASAVTVTSNPVPATTSISPASKYVGDATFTMTVNGTNFVSGSVVQFNGSARTTTYVSATQLTATIPASDLTVLGAFPIAVFNPAPGGGTSNAQTFTVAPAPPAATTDAVSGVTAAVAILNGTVSSNNNVTTVTFDYGLTTAYGNSITATQSPLTAGASNAPVSADLIGLNCNTVFHYRVVAASSAGTTYGLDGTFTTAACSTPFPPTACAATRYNNDLNCTSADLKLTDIALAAGSISSCVSGNPVSLNLDLTINFSSPDRWDVGIFIANDGKLPTLLPANGGASSCSVAVLPTTPPFLDLDGVPQGTADTCGDGNSSINGGTGTGVYTMTGVTLPCYASPDSGGNLFVPFVVTWDNQKSPIGNLCTSNQYPVPNTSSRCNAPASSVSVAVVVLPVITKIDGGSTINPGANTTYTVTVTNNSGGTLQNSFFKDPAVPYLTVNSLSCAAANGATCPIANNTVADMQGPTGIPIPSTNLPNNSSLIFTIDASVSSAAPLGSHLINTASVSIGSSSNSASDDDLIVLAPSAAKSFSPSTITEGAVSVLTITLANPTASPVTGVAFTDTYPAGLVNTASASAATTCGGTVTASDNGNSLALSGGTIPASGSCTVTVNVTSAAAGSYSNSTGAITPGIPAAAATLTVNVAVFGAFNACDVAAAPDAGCTSTTTVSTSHIATKIAGSPFSLDLVALKTDGSRNTNYGNTVLVELLDASNNSGAPDSNNCRSTWTTVIATLTPNPAFANSDNGLITVGTFTVNEAYRDVRVRVTNVGGVSRRGCSTDDFAIRPDSLALSATDVDWQTTGATRTLNNTDITSPGSSSGTPYPIHKAGQAFTITATAKNTSNATTLNYAGTTPIPVLGVCSPETACTSSLGTLALGGSGGGVSGVVTWSSASYSEVGAFDMTLQDTAFTSVDAGDTAASCAGRYICGTTSVGRFVPDHFDLTGTIAPADPSGFSYMDEPFGLSFTLAAKNAGGGTTANYASANNLAKLDPASASWPATGLGTDSSFGLGAKDGSTDLSGRLAVASGTTPSGTWTAGTAAIAASLSFARPTATSPDATWGPYETLDIGVAPQDADGVTLLPGALNLDADGDSTSERVKMSNATKLRFGRLRLVPGQGSERNDYVLSAEAQYWSGTAWITNRDDNHTTFAPGNAGVSWAGTGSAPTLSSIAAVKGGFGSILLGKPGGRGTAAICLHLATTTGACSATAGTLGFLGGNWSGGAFDRDPSAMVYFGRPRPDSLAPWGIIYQRENF